MKDVCPKCSHASLTERGTREVGLRQECSRHECAYLMVWLPRAPLTVAAEVFVP